jgi:hypothetical protein
METPTPTAVATHAEPATAPASDPAPASSPRARFRITHASPYQVVGVPRLTFANGEAGTDDPIFAHACREFGCTVEDSKA